MLTCLLQINTFHWHIVDSQSFPLQIDGFMDLSQKAAYSNSSVYTVKDVNDIVSYAAEVCGSISLDSKY